MDPQSKPNLDDIRKQIIQILLDKTFVDVYNNLHFINEELKDSQLETTITRIREAIENFDIPREYDQALSHMWQSPAIHNRPNNILESWLEDEFLNFFSNPESDDENHFVINPIENSVQSFFEKCFSTLGSNIARHVVEFLHDRTLQSNFLENMVSNYNHAQFMITVATLRLRASSTPRRTKSERKNSANQQHQEEEEKKISSESSHSVVVSHSSVTSFSGNLQSPNQNRNIFQGLHSYKSSTTTSLFGHPSAPLSDPNAIESENQSEKDSKGPSFDDFILRNPNFTERQFIDELLQLTATPQLYERFIHTMPQTLELRTELLALHENPNMDFLFYRSSVRKFFKANADLLKDLLDYMSQFNQEQVQKQLEEDNAIREYNEAIKPYENFMEQHVDTIDTFILEAQALRSIDINSDEPEFAMHFASIYDFYANFDITKFQQLVDKFKTAVLALRDLKDPMSLKVPDPFNKEQK